MLKIILKYTLIFIFSVAIFHYLFQLGLTEAIVTPGILTLIGLYVEIKRYMSLKKRS